MRSKSSDIYSRLLLLLILAVAFLLRFWHFTDIPFTFDELSAMSRTTYDNFRDLIKYGVIEKDTHPAGVQVFLYYWIRLFGEAEWVVKLPFMLMGLASVWVAYAVARLWFHSATAVLTAACMASLQLFVMYSQIARPYASGLFLTLMMVFFWSRYFLKGYRLTDLVLFILFAAMSGYNHHFSLLFAAIVGLSGLGFVKPEKRKMYIMAGVAIFVLYIPHLPVFFAQLQKGGIGGWLAKPSPWFLFQFITWLFHYSVWVALTLSGVVTFLFVVQKNKEYTTLRKVRLVMFLWFITPVVTGYFYSIWFEPIIQYSLLIFSTPYLFMLLFSYAGKVRRGHLAISVVLILAVNSLTLIYARDYYRVFYKQPFGHVVKTALALDRETPGKVMIINNYIPYYTEYYFRKYKQSVPYFTVRNKDLTIAEFKNVLSEIDQDIVITSGLKGIYFQLIKEQFPYWIGYDFGFTFEQYVFSTYKQEEKKCPERKLVTQSSFRKDENFRWQYQAGHVQTDPVSDDYVYAIKANEQYGVKVEMPLKELMDDIYWFVDVEVELKTDDAGMNAVIVGEIRKGQESVHWQGSAISEFGIEAGKWQKAFLTLDVQTAMNNQNKIDDQVLRFYIWNKGHNRLLIKNIRVFLRPGNPQRYSLLTN